jgi:membrane protease YdiL (CAAX protease family)
LSARQAAQHRRARNALLVLIPLLALPLLGVLRSVHEHVPRLPLLPAPTDSLLFWAVVFMAALHVHHRRRDRDLMPDIERGPGLEVGMIVPILLVAVAEKWASIELLEGSYAWIDAHVRAPLLADALYRLWSGLALLGVALALIRIPRQAARKLERLVLLSRLREAVGPVAAAALASAALVTVPALLADVPVRVRPGPEGAVAAMIGAQVVRGAAEELFFRGLLQTTLVRLLWQAGLPEGRTARLLAIGSVSLGFTLEHVDPAASLFAQRGELLWVFAISAVFGLLLEVSRNLYLVALTHTIVNLLLAWVLPLPVAESGGPLVPPAAPAVLFMMLLFVGVAIAHRKRGFA